MGVALFSAFAICHFPKCSLQLPSLLRTYLSLELEISEPMLIAGKCQERAASLFALDIVRGELLFTPLEKYF